MHQPMIGTVLEALTIRTEQLDQVSKESGTHLLSLEQSCNVLACLQFAIGRWPHFARGLRELGQSNPCLQLPAAICFRAFAISAGCVSGKT